MASAKKSLVVLAVAPALSWAVASEADEPGRYSHTARLSISGRQGVVPVALPRDLYLHAQTAGLDDVRIFDSAGRAQPFAIINPAKQRTTTRLTSAGRIFPVHDRSGSGGLPEGLEVRTSTDGSVLSVTTRAPGASRADRAALSSLIVDVQPPGDAGRNVVATRINALTVKPPAGTTNYTARVQVDTSSDLKNWTSVAETSLGWVVKDGTGTLASDRIEFDATPFRYARLSWVEGQPIEFAEIIAEFVQERGYDVQPHTLSLSPQPGRFPGDLVYQSPIAIPVETIGLQLDDRNVVVPSVLGQYAELPSRDPRAQKTYSFHPLLRTTFFHLTQDGRTRSSGDVRIAARHADHWVLRAEQGSDLRPQLRIGWTPSTAVFVAAGQPPYTLAVGRKVTASTIVPVERVAPGFTVEEIMSLERADVGALTQQAPVPGATHETDASPVMAARERIILLWGALVLGVVILGTMAWRLVRQMRHDGAGRPVSDEDTATPT